MMNAKYLNEWMHYLRHESVQFMIIFKRKLILKDTEHRRKKHDAKWKKASEHTN